MYLTSIWLRRSISVIQQHSKTLFSLGQNYLHLCILQVTNKRLSAMSYRPLPTTPSISTLNQRFMQVLQQATTDEARHTPIQSLPSNTPNSITKRTCPGVETLPSSSSNLASPPNATTTQAIPEDDETDYGDDDQGQSPPPPSQRHHQESPESRCHPLDHFRKRYKSQLTAAQLQQVEYHWAVDGNAVPVLSGLLGAAFTYYKVAAPKPLSPKRKRDQLVAVAEEAVEAQKPARLIVRLRLSGDKLAQFREPQPASSGLARSRKKRRTGGQEVEELPDQLSPDCLATRSVSEGLQAPLSRPEPRPKPSSRPPNQANAGHKYPTRSTRRTPGAVCEIPPSPHPDPPANRLEGFSTTSNVMESIHHNAYRASPFDETFRIEGNMLCLGSFVKTAVPNQDMPKEGPKEAWRRLFPGEGAEPPDNWRERMKLTSEGEWVARGAGDAFVPVPLKLSRDRRWEGRY
ncbi:uncharacterized protein K460DRAFT_2659 [Cucurbitaria berberidis CBS 394.84]|uniref:Uncharacterized protein n=1 Tax=Cucurbitaria berberidis CBS 394.84 TaxID=1168544 RepID=A0A9P4LD25_9PLEO|nr:uncharacterized protein K460DRAFT_2659 [Cucurbitaria berberidis CBS 394.84]KAF1849724.1 hypothetical protein K460DRAFT_2659 [Cucurbitaria berberidis CBS 394.84]